MITILLALANAFASSASNAVGALSTRSAPTTRVLLVSAGSSLVVAVSLANVTIWSTPFASLITGFAAGVIGACGLPLCYRAFAIGPVGLVSPVLSCVATLTLTCAAWADAGSLSVKTTIGLSLCLLAVLVATLDPARQSWRALFLASGAGLSFGAFSIVIARVPISDGFGPLVMVRLGVLSVALAIAASALLRKGQRGAPATSFRGRWILFAASAGLLDVAANLFFVLAVSSGALATVASVQSLSPVAAVFFGWLLLRQRPTARHGVAVGVAIVALAVIALPSASSTV